MPCGPGFPFANSAWLVRRRRYVTTNPIRARQLYGERRGSDEMTQTGRLRRRIFFVKAFHN